MMVKMVEPTAAQKELARRELARRHVIDFARYMADWYKPALVHERLAEMLELVALYIMTKGENGIGRLLIHMPPRHGKTELVCFFIAWLMGKLADTNVILASYNADLATGNSRKVRNLLMEPKYQAVFGSLAGEDEPVALADDSRSVSEWHLAAPHRGRTVAAGVGGGITGKGADLLVVDDPFKGREEAESEAQRERVWAWWQSSAYTRLEHGGAVVVIQTRWHPDDLAGRLLKAMASDPLADQYTVISLPALWEETPVPEGQTFADVQQRMHLDGVHVDQFDAVGRQEGEALWRGKYDEAALAQIKINVGDVDWQALYQQMPVARAGMAFQRAWFRVVESIPADDPVMGQVRYWDKAASAGEGDYSCGVLMAKTRSGRFYVVDVVRQQLSPVERNEKIRRVGESDAKRDGVVRLWQEVENSGAGKDSQVYTVQALAGLAVQGDVVGTKSKEMRALGWATACEAGLVHLVKASWNERYISEHVMFPKGKHDDQVDASAGAYGKLSRNNRSGIY